jgi:hypothetical protein
MPLPKQRIPFSQKNKDWQRDTINYFETLSYGSTTSNRNSNFNKKVNYDLFNGKFNKADLEYVCNPLGLKDNEFPATLQHYDIVSPPLNLLIGEETKRNDNCIVISGSPDDISRKQKSLKAKIIASLQEHLVGEIDPSTIDPNNPPPTPEEIVRYERHNVSDLIEVQGNKILKFLKKYLNTKEVFKKGWKDALLTAEEIYWTGISNNDVMLRRCNPLNVTVILDGDTDYVDDAIGVIEIRMLSPATIIDEFGDKLTPSEVEELEKMSMRYTSAGTSPNSNPTFTIDQQGSVIDTGLSNFSSLNSTVGSFNSQLIRVVRVEWKSFKKMFHLSYTDEEGIPQEKIVDESFKTSIFKSAFPDTKTEEFWINEAWEGLKIGAEIFIDVKPKENQRRRMDNPYYCKLGYTGLLYNSTNSKSVSLLDRLKPYQYLYNIISYRLELAFASDQGRIFLMDLAQIPRSEGMDIERWMYYMKAMKIAFINSHEEGKKGAMTGKTSNFNQFQSIDLSLANQIQQYIQTLDYIKQQTAFISGVSPQRLGAISSQELVGNVQQSLEQSALITEYLFDSHNEVKRRVYTAMIECAKIAFKDGKKTQFILDDMGIELLDIEECELDNTEFNVFMSNSNKDLQIVESLKQLAQAALQSDKADLSTIIDTMINDSPKDIVRTIQKGEAAKYARDKQAQDQQAQVQQAQIKAQQDAVAQQLADKDKDRQLKQYEIDSNNETKLQVAQINVYSRQEDLDQDNDGIPDPIELGKLSMQERNIASKAFNEKMKLDHTKQVKDKEMSIKEKEINNRKEIEDKKIEAIRVQNVSQEKISKEESARSDRELNAKIQIEKLKLAAAKAKANKPNKK